MYVKWVTKCGTSLHLSWGLEGFPGSGGSLPPSNDASALWAEVG